MELFKLIGRIVVNGADEAQKDLEKTSKKTTEFEKAMKGLQTGVSNAGTAIGNTCKAIGSAVVEMGKIGAAGITALSAGITALSTSAIKSYADYEQLVGGVETLFKDSAGTIMNYADEAYKNAGLSANDYMETITGFSASLIQSLGGDTAKAAEVGNRAIEDMSDNANKMGTSMESIQNAYQGFAKQNYTMLDNLKLGYGGTGEEMARLIADASQMTEEMDALGVSVDGTDMSFANIVNAISVVQKHLDITGTTSKEAATTISGSIGTMKSAWTNLLTSFSSDDMDAGVYVNKFVDSLLTVLNNLSPVIQRTVPALVDGLSSLVKSMVPYIPSMLAEMVPAIVSGATSLLSEVVNELPNILETLLPGIGGKIGNTLSKAVSSIASLFTKLAPLIQQFADRLLPPLLDFIDQLIPFLIQIAEEILPVFLELVEMLLPPMMDIVEAIMPIIVQLIQMLLPPIMEIVQSILPIIVTLINAILPLLQPLIELLQGIISNVMTLLEPILQLINIILPPLIKIISEIIGTVLNIVIPMLNSLASIFSGVLSVAMEAVMPIVEAVMGVFENAVKVIMGAWEPVSEFFGNIWKGIQNTFSSVTDWFKDVFSKAWQAVKDVFSTGGKIFDGIKNGIADVFKNVVNKIIAGINTVISIPFNAINNTLDGIRNINILGVTPFTWISTFGVPEIPQLKKGGVLEEGQTGYLEGDGAEAVVPLDQNKKWIRALREDMEAEFSMNNDSSAILNKLDELIKAIMSLKIYLNNDVMVGELAPAMNTALGNISFANARGQ